jgi:hypothetical protein
MEFNIALLSALIGLFIAGFNAAIFVVWKFNDLVHLGKSLEEMKKTLGEISCKVDDSAERISKVEGILAARGKKK